MDVDAEDSPSLRNGWAVARHVATRALAIGGMLAALWGAASGLVRASHALRQSEADVAARRADEATRAGRLADAVEALREAVALDPARIDHRLALARSLIALGRPADAEPWVRDVLHTEPVRGDANLALARALAAQGQADEAEAAYYRAIYGRWAPADQPLRMRARLELIALFERGGHRERLRTALLELSTAFPGDRVLQIQAGQDLLRLGFADDAARQLQLVVDRFTDPGPALGLLGQAEFARGRVAEAFLVTGRALARNPEDQDAARLRGLAAQVLSIDPDQPRLSARARQARVRILLQRARGALGQCGPDDSSLHSAIDAWLRQRGTADEELGRALLQAAAARLDAECMPDEATGVVLARLSRRTPA